MGKLVSEQTALRLLHLLNSTGVQMGGPRTARPHWVLVRCESETAVGGSSVLDQCYPGLILAPAADFPAPPEEGFGILLTLLGASGESVRPRLGAVYPCLLTGEVEGDRSGSGSGMVSGRPRAFGVPLAETSASGDCSGCGWVAALKDTDCLRVSVASAVGACACAADAAEVYLSSEDGETWGASAGAGSIANECCPSNPLPTTLYAVSSDGETVVLTHNGSGNWTGLTSASDQVIFSCAGVATLSVAGSVETDAGAVCDPFEAVFDYGGGLTWTVSASDAAAGVLIELCEVVYGVVFDRSGPTLSLTPLSASGAAIEGILDCCGCGYAIFAFGGLPICSGTDTGTGPCDNLLRLKVEWSCCPIEGWAGEGWYCVRAAGTEFACVAVELLDEDKCGDSIEICSGPYATQEEAEANCPGEVESACQEPPIPAVLNLTVTHTSGNNPDLGGTFPLFWAGVDGLGANIWCSAPFTLANPALVGTFYGNRFKWVYSDANCDELQMRQCREGIDDALCLDWPSLISGTMTLAYGTETPFQKSGSGGTSFTTSSIYDAFTGVLSG